MLPGIGLQLSPDGSHRFHWYAKAVGSFVQAPRVAVRIEPRCGVPLIVGGAVFAGGFAVGGGGGGGGGGGAAETTAVALLVAEPDPAAFVPVTVTRMVLPTAKLPSVSCVPVAPETEAQFAPAVSQRFHWYA